MKETDLNIFLLNIEENESDYIVKFCLNLLEACSLNESVPAIVNRIILNNLSIQISDEEIIFTEKHREMAFTKIENIRTEILFDFVSKMKLQHRVNPEFYKDLTKSHI